MCSFLLITLLTKTSKLTTTINERTNPSFNQQQGLQRSAPVDRLFSRVGLSLPQPGSERLASCRREQQPTAISHDHHQTRLPRCGAVTAHPPRHSNCITPSRDTTSLDRQHFHQTVLLANDCATPTPTPCSNPRRIPHAQHTLVAGRHLSNSHHARPPTTTTARPARALCAAPSTRSRAHRGCHTTQHDHNSRQTQKRTQLDRSFTLCPFAKLLLKPTSCQADLKSPQPLSIRPTTRTISLWRLFARRTSHDESTLSADRRVAQSRLRPAIRQLNFWQLAITFPCASLASESSLSLQTHSRGGLHATPEVTPLVRQQRNHRRSD